MGVIPIELESFIQWIACIIGILLGLVVQGEAQEYFVHMFEVYSKRTKIEYDLNPIHHVSIWSIPVLLFAGWGWSARKVAEPDYFPSSPIPRFLLPLSAPVANMALAGIIGTLYIFLPIPFFRIITAISIQMAVANCLIPIPPLALGRSLSRPFGPLAARQLTIERWGAVLLAFLVVLDYYTNLSIFRPWIMQISEGILRWVLKL